jgi:hypothetical protein
VNRFTRISSIVDKFEKGSCVKDPSDLVKRTSRNLAFITPPQTPTSANKARVVLTDLPFHSPANEDWSIICKKKLGRDSPSTVTSTSYTESDDTGLPAPPLFAKSKPGRWLNPVPTVESEAKFIPVSARDRNVVLLQATFRRWHASKQCLLVRIAALDDEIMEHQVSAATKIQSVWRAWTCQMKLRIIILEKRLARSHQRKNQALHWVTEERRLGMDRIEHGLSIVARKDEIKSGRDLAKTHELVEWLRKDNKELRVENRNMTHVNDAMTEKHRRLRERSTSLSRRFAVIQTRVPHLECEKDRIASSLALFEQRAQEFEDALELAQDFTESEEKTTANVKGTILKTLTLIKESCTDQELSEDINVMGITELFKNAKLIETLKTGSAEESKKLTTPTVVDKKAPVPNTTTHENKSVPPPPTQVEKTFYGKKVVTTKQEARKDDTVSKEQPVPKATASTVKGGKASPTQKKARASVQEKLEPKVREYAKLNADDAKPSRNPKRPAASSVPTRLESV